MRRAGPVPYILGALKYIRNAMRPSRAGILTNQTHTHIQIIHMHAHTLHNMYNIHQSILLTCIAGENTPTDGRAGSRT